MRLALLILLVSLMVSCKEEEVFTPVFEVPSEAMVYVERFFTEAENRNISLATNNLIIRFQEELNDQNNQPVCGNARGALTSDQQNVILIDPECLAWQFDELSKEILIFHELGHALLERSHQNELFPTGDYQSIMFGGNWNVRRFYTQDLTKRSYYIDELFNQQTPTPDWAK